MKKPLVIVCFGDSTTDAFFQPLAGYEKDYLNLKVYSEILQDELPGKLSTEIKIINAGMSGDTTNDARLRFTTDVLQHNPHCVIIQFGANDQAIRQYLELSTPKVDLANYTNNLLFFISRVRRAGGKPLLLTPGIMSWKNHFRAKYFKLPYDTEDRFGLSANLTNYVNQVKLISAIVNVPLIDIYQEELKF